MSAEDCWVRWGGLGYKAFTLIPVSSTVGLSSLKPFSCCNMTFLSESTTQDVSMYCHSDITVCTLQNRRYDRKDTAASQGQIGKTFLFFLKAR